jgi:hypothetical protein
LADKETDVLQTISYLIANGLKITTPNNSGVLAHSLTEDVSRQKLLNHAGDLPVKIEPPVQEKDPSIADEIKHKIAR